jgi:uncharacterized membrane protein
MNPLLYVALASLSPVGELRAAIPLGLALKENLTTVMLIALIGNLLVAPFSFVALRIVGFRKLAYRLLGARIIRKISKHRKRFETWEELALIPFVAVPLPGTGAYTGVLLAEFLGLNRIKSTLTIAIGVCLAGIITLFLTLGAIKIF